MRENIKTVKELLLWSTEHYASNEFLQVRNKTGYDAILYSQLGEDAKAMASYLTKEGFGGKHIAMMGENSYRWVVSYFGVVLSGGVAVPIDKELPPVEVASIVKDSDSVAYIFSADYTDAAKYIGEQMPQIACFAMDNKRSTKDYINMDTMLVEGATDKESMAKAIAVPSSEDDLCSIVFTSGTTGFSKGVMLTNKNVISNIKSAYRFHEKVHFGASRFSLLPMHHTLELNLGIIYSLYQGSTSSLNNSIKYISQNIKIFRPTDLLIVPLVADALYNGIWTNIRSQGKEPLVKFMIKVSNFLLKMGIDVRRKLFNQVHEGLGGRLNHIFCGGAAMDPEMVEGFIDFGFNFSIGYGITECSPLISGNITNIKRFSHTCGVSVDCNEMKIDSPNENGEGEIIVRGDNVMVGYYKREDATAAVLQDGWFRTGDIGRIDSDGMMIITGRVKNLIVLNNGKNVYPEEIESYVGKVDGVAEVVVSSIKNENGDEISLKAEIFVSSDWAEQNSQLDAQAHIREKIEQLNEQLAYYKRIAEVYFRDTEFPKTTTKKIKRY